MKSLDRFFDFYGRFTPRWFSDAAAAALALGVIVLILG